jgi:hypothetical protein
METRLRSAVGRKEADMVHPINFKLTPEAAIAVRDIVQNLQFQQNTKLIPGIVHIKGYKDKNNVESIGVTGFYAHETQVDDIKHVMGLDLVYPVTDEGYQFFEGKTIDYKDKKFYFTN